MKVNSIMVPGSVITAQTSTGYLFRLAKNLFSRDFGLAESVVLSEIEERIVKAGFLTWVDVDNIEIEAAKAI